MPRSDILHAVHELTNYSEKYVEQNYGVADPKHYYHANKRKRKTIPPQKRDMSEDEMEDTHSSGHESMEHEEPINLMKREADINHSVDIAMGKNIEPTGVNSTLSVEQHRMYNILLNYLLMKYQTQSDPKDVINNSPITKLFGRHSEVCPQSPDPHFNSSLFSSIPLSANPYKFGGNADCNQECPSVNGASSTSNIIKPVTFRYGLCQSEPWKQSIISTLNNCINNIPIPKSGYENYDAMLLCYKSLIEKAFALQQALDIYLNLLHSAPSSAGSSLDAISSCISNRFAAMPSARFEWNQAASLTPVVCTSSPGLSGVNPSVQKNSSDIYGGQNVTVDWKRHDATFKCERDASPDQKLNACPVDLTKSEKPCQSIPPISSVKTQGISSGTEITDRLGREGAHFLSRFFNGTSTELSTTSDYNGLSSHNSSTDFNLSPSSDKFEFSPRSVKDHNSLGSSRLGETISSIESSYISNSGRGGISLRRKSYFKTKRLKKSFSSVVTSVNNDNSDSAQVKKSNFRGTSEEENRVAPDFQPIEINVSD
ncbi:hypothetical protein FBUS_01562 [Fasciolopsis buskii]|uniref:Uncharacterized protein n=1 Tax=Fasciolopsis buskii TaxID=27845 RepID=A0A8E0RVQ6_9TREM|nr:hypothetical protein FBUS_01562 [Fasciolopsis buski]